MAAQEAEDVLDRSQYVLEMEDLFVEPSLGPLWIPEYLPHWTSAADAAARYEVGDGRLVLRIDADQPAWSPEFTGGLRVSGLQTGTVSGPVGSRVGQHRFRDDLVVRVQRPTVARYTPRYGLFEMEAQFSDDPTTMAALWLIGYEDEPERSGEICIAEVFGRNVGPDQVGIGMGIHPFHDPALHEDFGVVDVALDARTTHQYAAAWTSDRVAFYVDDRLVKIVDQSPTYPMQLMLDLYEFRAHDLDASDPPTNGERYPKQFVVHAVRTYRPAGDRVRPRL